jgi:hypothetical protein
MNTILCKLGIHRPLNINLFKSCIYSFTDLVSKKQVKHYNCPCGKLWMSDGGKWFGFKVMSKESEVVNNEHKNRI